MLLNTMPTAAAAQMSTSITTAVVGDWLYIETSSSGVYVPAMSRKTPQWSRIRNTRLAIFTRSEW